MDDEINGIMDRLSWLLVEALLIVTPLFQGRWITPNVYTVRVARCSVDWDVERGIVVLACVGRDMIEIWPLSTEGLRLADANERPDGDMVCRA